MDATVYPVSAQFEKTAMDLTEQQADNEELANLGQSMLSTLSEYEHGTANPEEVFRDIPGFDLSDVDDDNKRRNTCLRLIAAAYTDLLLTVANS